jgi:hypothetical protein
MQGMRMARIMPHTAFLACEPCPILCRKPVDRQFHDISMNEFKLSTDIACLALVLAEIGEGAVVPRFHPRFKRFAIFFN